MERGELVARLREIVRLLDRSSSVSALVRLEELVAKLEQEK